MNKNRGEQLQEVVGALCFKLLTSNKEQLRDVASLGLKTVVAGGWLAGGLGEWLAWLLQGCPREWQGQEVLSFSCLHSSSET